MLSISKCCRRLPVCLLGLLIVSLAGMGCSGSAKPLYPVRGKALWNGEPLPKGIVAFHPTAGEYPTNATTMTKTNDEGAFTMPRGLPAGEYKVTVVRMKRVPKKSNPKEKTKDKKNVLPTQYETASTSEMRVVIQEGDNELEPFRLVGSLRYPVSLKD